MNNAPCRAKRASLCWACKGIGVEKLVIPGGYAHHLILTDWIESAVSCRLCALMLGKVYDNDSSGIWLPGGILEAIGCESWRDLMENKRFQSGYRLRLFFDKDTKRCNVVAANNSDELFDPARFLELPLSEDSSHFGQPLTRVDLYTDDKDMASLYGVPWRRRLPQNTGCEASIKVAQLWLSQCLESHKGVPSAYDEQNICAACDVKGSVKNYAAARLVKISASKVLVVPASEVNQHYATLSYSWRQGPQWPWGPRHIQRDAIGAIADTGLCRTSLPETIRDAVGAVEQLGLCYIWIDVLCIKQDDADFIRESVKMATIFSQARFCISASNSASNQSGLFNKRSRSQHHGFATHIPTGVDVNVLGSGLVFYQRNEGSDSIAKTIPWLEGAEPELLREDAYSQEIEQGRLAQRAWVLQERICSPRILHFDATQIFWQCNRKTWTEDNLGAQLSEDMWGMHFWKYNFFPRNWDDFSPIGGYELFRQDKGKQWTQQIISRFYSSEQLTYWDDKLVAVAGLAKLMWQQHPKMHYIAGHWQEALPSSLLWYYETPGRRIKPCVAPSWSWASIQGRIHMKNEMAEMQDSAIRCEVTDCWVETSGDDQFGRVLDAGLQIEALAWRGAVAGRTSANRISGNLELNGIDAIETRVNLDDDHDDKIKVFALSIKQNHIKHPNADAPWHWDVLLVVLKDGDPKQSMRVGVGAINLPQEIPLGDERLIKSRWVLCNGGRACTARMCENLKGKADIQAQSLLSLSRRSLAHALATEAQSRR